MDESARHEVGNIAWKKYIQMSKDDGTLNGISVHQLRTAIRVTLDAASSQAKQARNAALDEALAVVPGGSICDPQQVADAIAALKDKSSVDVITRDRAPLPPDVLAGALQDRAHREIGNGRPARSGRVNGGDKS